MLVCAHTRVINVFHFKDLAILWWHSHSSRVKQHLPAGVSIIKYFKQHAQPPPPSPPRDRCRYHFCQSQFPSAFVIPAHIYELSIAVSGCKITDVLRDGIGWDYLGLSINAYSLSLSFPCHYFLINLEALWGCNVFVGGGGSGAGWGGVLVTEAVVILSNITPRRGGKGGGPTTASRTRRDYFVSSINQLSS